MDSLSIKEARRQFAKLVNSAGRGKPVAITRRGQAVAQITPIAPGKRPPLPNLAAFRAEVGKPPAKSKATIGTLRQQDRY